MTTESSVTLPPDGAGKAVDTVTVTDTNAVARYRQVAALGDSDVAANIARITGDGRLHVVDRPIEDVLTQMLMELRVQTVILHSTLGCRDDIDLLRAAENLITFQQTE